MRELNTARLAAAFDLTADLVTGLEEADMNRSLPVPSNTIWDQLWCVVGAREGYARAMEAGDWMGFSCSLTSSDRGSRERLEESLEASRQAVVEALSRSEDGERALDLLLHETQHHGQLIRFLYGLGLDFPESWRRRWSL